MDSDKIIKDICDFLKNHGEILNEHHEEFISSISFLKRFVNGFYVDSIHGHHYSNCCWSSNQCQLGPDTCACYMIENRLVRIKKLMLFYKNWNKVNKK